MAEIKSTGENTGRAAGLKNLIPWKPGQSGNPAGKKLGTRNRKTVIMEAIRKMAKANGMGADELEELLHASALHHAIKKGSFFHYSEIANGLYGKITDKMDLTSDGKSFAELIIALHARRKPAGNGARRGVRQGAGASK